MSKNQMETGGFKEVKNRRQYKRRDVLDKVASGDLKPEDAEKMLKRNPPRFVVTKNGAIALFNLQRTPVVLYADQWQKIGDLMKRDIFDKFLERNKDIVQTKKRDYYQSKRNNTDVDEEEVDDEE